MGSVESERRLDAAPAIGFRDFHIAFSFATRNRKIQGKQGGGNRNRRKALSD
jgi:hypothetical protein